MADTSKRRVDYYLCLMPHTGEWYTVIGDKVGYTFSDDAPNMTVKEFRAKHNANVSKPCSKADMRRIQFNWVKMIREVNDELRGSIGNPKASEQVGQVLITRAFGELPESVQTELLEQVRTFDDFSSDNDPHKEHDLGVIKREGAEDVMWKIDYYDTEMRYHSPNKADSAVTRRVLTVMLASDY